MWTVWPSLSWLSADTTGSIDPTQYGIAGVLFVVFGGVILRLFLMQRADLLSRILAAETQRDEAVAREKEALEHERVRADRLETALATLNAEVGPRQAAAMDNAMKAVTDAIRELKR